MTTYTADDFKGARFATHPDGRLAARTFPDDTWPWITRENVETDASEQYKDRDMRDLGFVPVQETPRPLTPDAITDEMVLRFMNTYDRLSDGSKDAPTLNHFTAARTSLTRSALTAALTEPPARPEGAEDIEALILDAEHAGEGADNEALANYLAARLTDPTRKEA